MIDLIISALSLGLMLSVFVGPIFFLLIEGVGRHGKKAGQQVILGALLGDVIAITLAYLIIDELIKIDTSKQWVSVLGGVFLIVFSLFYAFKKNKTASRRQVNSGGYVTTALFINIINPSVWFFWLAAITYGKLQFHSSDVITYLCLALLTAVLIDYLKLFLMYSIFRRFSTQIFTYWNKVTALVLLVLGCIILLRNI